MFRRGRTDTTSDSVDAVQYFNNTQHSVDIGPTYMFEGGDTLFFKYNYSTGESVPEGSGATTSYTFQTIAPEYVTKTLVPSWTLTISAGPTLVTQSGTHAFLSGKLGLATDYDRRTHVAMLVSRQAIPSYFATGSSTISNRAQFNVTYGFTRLLRLTAGAYYAYNETVPVKTFASRTVRGTVALNYSLTESTTLVLSQDYNYYERTGVLPYDRIVTMLTLKTEWK
jgi:predicted porin